MFFDNYINIDAAHVLDFRYEQHAKAELAFRKKMKKMKKIVNVNAANRLQIENSEISTRESLPDHELQ